MDDDYEKGVAAYKAKDYPEAVRCYSKAAEQGNVLAQSFLGLMYKEGDGVAQDDREAARLLRKAAEQGHTDAQVSLGAMYAKGQGVVQDGVQAQIWLNISAALGNPIAKEGRQRVEKLLSAQQIAEAQSKAKEWLQAHEKKDPMDDFEKGFVAFGNQDIPEAAHLFRKAAEQGHARAQRFLGGMYREGTGVAQDHREAVRWYRKAAEQGHTGAQVSLGAMYAKGHGAAQDYVQTQIWLNIAAALGDQEAKEARQMMEEEKLLSADQIAEAKREATKWLEAYQKRRP